MHVLMKYLIAHSLNSLLSAPYNSYKSLGINLISLCSCGKLEDSGILLMTDASFAIN